MKWTHVVGFLIGFFLTMYLFGCSDLESVDPRPKDRYEKKEQRDLMPPAYEFYLVEDAWTRPQA